MVLRRAQEQYYRPTIVGCECCYKAAVRGGFVEVFLHSGAANCVFCVLKWDLHIKPNCGYIVLDSTLCVGR